MSQHVWTSVILSSISFWFFSSWFGEKKWLPIPADQSFLRKYRNLSFPRWHMHKFDVIQFYKKFLGVWVCLIIQSSSSSHFKMNWFKFSERYSFFSNVPVKWLQEKCSSKKSKWKMWEHCIKNSPKHRQCSLIPNRLFNLIKRYAHIRFGDITESSGSIEH